MTKKSNVDEIYPGAADKDQDGGQREIGFPVVPLNTLLGFDLETYQIPLDCLLPSKRVAEGIMGTRKFKQIVSSINEIGLIEPLPVISGDEDGKQFFLLDGHLRALALKNWTNLMLFVCWQQMMKLTLTTTESIAFRRCKSTT